MNNLNMLTSMNIMTMANRNIGNSSLTGLSLSNLNGGFEQILHFVVSWVLLVLGVLMTVKVFCRFYKIL